MSATPSPIRSIAAWIGLFRRFILRRVLEERLRTAVTVLGIALGIAVVIAIQLTNASSVRGFEAAIETVAGKTSLEVHGPGPGFDELLLNDVGWLRAYGDASPVIEGDALAATPDGARESIRVLGVDILKDRSIRDYSLLAFTDDNRQPRVQEFLGLLIDPRSIVLTEKFARRHGLAVDSELELTTGDVVERFRVRALLKDEGPARTLDGNFALMDIAAAQLAFQRLGRLNRVDVRLADGVNIDRAEKEIRERLPEGLLVRRPERRGQQVEKMLAAFQFNLTALSYIALFVGLFLVYNTVSISVIARREEIGTLRALGTSRGTVLSMFLAEAASLAIAGCAIGVVLGRVLAEGAVRITSTTVDALYIAAAAEPVPLGVWHVLLAFGIGVPLALLAAAIPALEAARVAPTAAMRGSDRLETRFRLNPRLLIVPLALFALGWWLSTLRPIGGRPIGGYASALAIVFGAAFLVPAVLYFACRIGERVLVRFFGIEGRLATANLAAAIPRISISVAALAVSLSMMVAIAVMIGSFRETVIRWIDQTLQADLYVRPVTRTNIATESTISPEVVTAARAIPGVTAVDTFRSFDIPYGDATIILGSSDFEQEIVRRKLAFKEPADGPAALTAAHVGNGAIVSESFAIRYERSVGDSVTIPTPKGEREFRIEGVFYDYSSDRGAMIIDRVVFTELYGDSAPTNLAVYLAEGVDPEAARQQLLDGKGDSHRIFVFTNAKIRAEVLRIFDSTFAITTALEIIAIFVAIMGVASTLLTLVIERRRELAVLRLVGADRRQVRKMIVIEAMVIGGVSQTIGIGVGLLLSLVLIYVINVQSFGWTIQFRLPVAFLLQSTVLIVVATALSGIYPARRACALNAPEQTAEE